MTKINHHKSHKIENKFCMLFIKMNPKVRGTSTNSSIRAIKSKTVRLRKKVIQELKELIYRQKGKNKSYNTRRTVNRLGLK